MEREESPTERAVFNLATAWQESEAKLAAATARAEKAEALYAKAWAECEEWRDEVGIKTDGWRAKHDENDDCAYTVAMDAADAHDAARREAGL